MIKEEKGFSTPLALTIIFSLCLLIISFSMIITSYGKMVDSYREKIDARKEVNKILYKMEEKIQRLKNYNYDSVDNIDIYTLLDCDNIYNLSIKDVSTGINKNFMSENFLNNSFIRNYTQHNNEMTFTEYGWINKQTVSTELLNKIKETNGIENSFPIINLMPLYNINYMSTDFIIAILNFCNINDAESKTNQLLQISSDNITKEKISQILNIPLTNSLFNYIGIKTNFWKIQFETEHYFVSAIFAAIPDKENLKTIVSYKLIEKQITNKGGII